jgi:hypothetical protein
MAETLERNGGPAWGRLLVSLIVVAAILVLYASPAAALPRPVARSEAVHAAATGPSCDPQFAGRQVAEFFTRISSRSPTGAVQLFELGAPLEWFADNGDRDYTFQKAVTSASVLRRYVKQRAAAHDRTRLVALEGGPGWGDQFHMTFQLRRRASDIDRATPLVWGKGAIDCTTGLIAVLTLAPPTTNARLEKIRICPRPSTPGTGPIVCWRLGISRAFGAPDAEWLAKR